MWFFIFFSAEAADDCALKSLISGRDTRLICLRKQTDLLFLTSPREVVVSQPFVTSHCGELLEGRKGAVSFSRGRRKKKTLKISGGCIA